MKAVKATCAGRGGGARARSSATLGCSHRLSLLPYFFNYRIFSYKEKNTWWAWQVAHSTGIGWYLVCMSSVRWTAGLPSILMNLGKSNSLYTTYQTGSWGFKRSKQLLMADGEMLVCPLSFSVHYGGIATHNHISET